MKRIKIWLIRNGMSQADLARELRISQAYLHLVLAGKRKAPGIRNKLVRECGVPRKLVDLPERRAA